MEAGFATQGVLHARLTRFYERQDWQQRLKACQEAPLMLERGLPQVMSAQSVRAAALAALQRTKGGAA